MSRFRRRGQSGDDEGQTGAEQPQEGGEQVEVQQPAAVADGSDRSAGPWDSSEQVAGETYIDLGALRLPAREGLEIRLDVEEQTGAVTAATVLLAGSVVQLQAFAAPRTEGIWPEIRTEIAAMIAQQGGTADEVPGAFGHELLAQIPARGADGSTVNQAARFAGVDGPRWFLRAVFHGPAAFDAAAAEPLEAVVRGVVVVRGSEAMAPRELLGLHLPQDLTQGQPDAEPEPAGLTDERYPIDPFERGPEITEVR